MRIAIGSDHAGFKLKNIIIEHLKKRKIPYKDFGAFSEESVDYPDFAFSVANAVKGKKFDRGILVCGTGIGMSISANKVKGIRAAVCNSRKTARLAREHNDANVLCIGARILKKKDALDIVRIFLTTKFLGGRHLKRIKKILSFERG